MALPDSFTGTTGTELNAYDALWVKHSSYSSGRIDINGNTAKINAASSSAYYYNSSPSSADYDVQAVVNFSSTASNVGGVCGRFSSSANTMYHARLNGSNIELYKFVAGTATLLGSAVAHGITTGADAVLKLSMSGTSITALVDGVSKINATDSAISSTGFGGIRATASGGSISFDNFDISGMSGGGNVTITGNIGDATAAGLTATVSQAASIAAGVGNSVAAGSQASVSQQYTLSAGVGDATAAGLTATITASGLTTISCTTGNAAAAGYQAVVNSAATVTCSVGNAAAAGLTAALDTAYTILANVGNATADGLSATIQAATGISCGVANAIAAGLTASVTNNAALTDSEKIDLILDILSNRQTLDPSTGVYTLYADDGTTVLKTAQAWEDAAGTIPYRGRALQRLDAME